MPRGVTAAGRGSALMASLERTWIPRCHRLCACAVTATGTGAEQTLFRLRSQWLVPPLWHLQQRQLRAAFQGRFLLLSRVRARQGPCPVRRLVPPFLRRGSALSCRVPDQPGSTSGPGTGTGLGSALYQPAQARPLGVVFDHPRRGPCPFMTAPSPRLIPVLPQQVSCTFQRGVSRGSATAGSPPRVRVIPRGSACIRPPRTGPIVAACWPVHGHTEASVRPARDHKVAIRRPENSSMGPQRSWWPPRGPSLARTGPDQSQDQPRSGHGTASGHSVANVGPIVDPCWPAVLCLGPSLAIQRPLLAT